MDRPSLDDFIARAEGMRRREDLDAAAVEVLDAFEATGVKSVVLKGPALARFLYAEEENRGYLDVDLLVAPGDLPRARQALAELGYEKPGDVLGVDDVAGIQHSETWAQAGESDPLWVDLHWRLAGCEAPAQVAWEALAARRSWIKLGGRDAAVLNRDGLALHMALHAAQNGPEDVKAMGDLVRGIERWPREAWQSAARLADEVEAMPAFAAGLRLVPSGAEVATELALPETRQLEWEVLHRDARPRGTFHLQAFSQARGVRGRADVVRRSLLPTPEWIAWEYPWVRRRRAPLVAAYLAHFFRAPVWAARAWRFRRRARRGAANPQ